MVFVALGAFCRWIGLAGFYNLFGCDFIRWTGSLVERNLWSALARRRMCECELQSC